MLLEIVKLTEDGKRFSLTKFFILNRYINLLFERISLVNDIHYDHNYRILFQTFIAKNIKDHFKDKMDYTAKKSKFFLNAIIFIFLSDLWNSLFIIF